MFENYERKNRDQAQYSSNLNTTTDFESSNNVNGRNRSYCFTFPRCYCTVVTNGKLTRGDFRGVWKSRAF